jgi:hypothetical protein
METIQIRIRIRNTVRYTLNTFVKDDVVCAHQRVQQEPGDTSGHVSCMQEGHWQCVHKTTGKIFSLYD